MKERVFSIFLASACALSLMSCSGEAPEATIIKIDEKKALLDWPDSLYVASLDSILALEPVKKTKEEKTNINFSSRKAPVFQLPASVTGKKESTKHASQQSARGNAPKAEKGETTNKGSNAEAFATRFTNALQALQSDPSNPKLFIMVSAKDEDVFALMKRTYGAGSQSLPRFFVTASLKTLNPHVDLEQLKDSDKVKLPRL